MCAICSTILYQGRINLTISCFKFSYLHFYTLSGLNEKLQRLENALAKQDLYLKEKDDTIAILKELRDNMENKLEKVKKKNEGQWEEIQRIYGS